MNATLQNIEDTEYMDGVLLLSDSWAFLAPMTNFILKHLEIKKINKTVFKGLDGFGKTQKMFRIDMGICQEGNLAQVLFKIIVSKHSFLQTCFFFNFSDCHCTQINER